MQEMTPAQGQTYGRIRNPEPWAQPSSSRMLTTYLADVEQMLDEHRWDLAMRDALDLPVIAVALSNPALTASDDQCKAWCEQWIQAAAATSDFHHTRVCNAVAQHPKATDQVPTGTVPSKALRRLRLRRHARSAPRGFKATRQEGENQHAAHAIEVCNALVEAMRRWYAHVACHDPITQANLARLAVLR